MVGLNIFAKASQGDVTHIHLQKWFLYSVPNSFSYSLKGTIFFTTLTENRNPKGRLFPCFHCNMFSCLETSPVVLRTGYLSFLISFPQRTTYRLTYPFLNLSAHLTLKVVLLWSSSQLSQKFSLKLQIIMLKQDMRK